MKRVCCLLLSITILLSIAACSKQIEVATWQEQYDLGIRYLSEGNYEEAIIAFTTAIEIDPKQAPAYVGRGDTYVLSGETEENLVAAKADYEKAIELDETLAEAYLGLTDVYIQQGDFESALEILEHGYEKTGEVKLSNRIREIGKSQDTFYNSESFIEYDNLSEEWQDYLASVVEAFASDNETAVIKILSERNTGNETDVTLTDSGYMLRTKNSNYKICWERFNVGSLVGEYFVKVEIRPQNGTAYSAEYDFEDIEEMTSFSQGDCVNWNWNGDFTQHTSWRQSEVQYFFNGRMKDCFIDRELLTIIEQNNLDEPIEYLDDYEYGLIASGANGSIRSGATTLGFDSVEDAKQYLWWD